MKKVIFVLSLISLNSFAQTVDKPFSLDAGKYSFECWSAYVSNTNGKTNRHDSYAKGLTTVFEAGPVKVETTQSQSDDTVSNSITKTITTDLGNGIYKVERDFNGTIKFETESFNQQMKSESVVKVEGNREINLKVKRDNKPEVPGVGETVWKKMEDGRIIEQSYSREKSNVTNPDGQETERLVSNELCIYTATK